MDDDPLSSPIKMKGALPEPGTRAREEKIVEQVDDDPQPLPLGG